MDIRLDSERQSKTMSRRLAEVFSFPHPVNETAARLVAAMVLALSLAIILTGETWLLVLLTYGFLARVLTGPTLSPMGQIASRVLATLLNSYKPAAGPPKRFAQTVGLGFSIAALVLHYGLELTIAAKGVLVVLVLFASLEAFVGFCMGCFVFGYLMKMGLVPLQICEKCNNLKLARTEDT